MLETARDQSFPKLTQISFFLPNRVGSLQRVVHVLEQAHIQICALSILDAHDHAVVRMVVDKPHKAIETMGTGGRQVCTSQLLGVALPGDEEHGVSRLLATMVRAELNVMYMYTMLVRWRDMPVLAVHVDNLDEAAAVVRRAGFELVEQDDLESK
ncbi:MAG TPA: hypothetical protein VK081_10100 [Planctomycetota bacterium]|nr:hypothetical protein [Planctomycetota bacterium]